MLQTIALIFLGGGLGSLARFGVSLGVKQFSESTFPIATLIANVLSCLIIGIALSVFATKLHDNNLRMFVVVGFCGGFSTFSTFSLETVELFRRGQVMIGAANVLISVTLCLLVLAFLIKKN
ncbi:fluoride efflux transporter CrcB [soil metagenome]